MLADAAKLHLGGTSSATASLTGNDCCGLFEIIQSVRCCVGASLRCGWGRGGGGGSDVFGRAVSFMFFRCRGTSGITRFDGRQCERDNATKTLCYIQHVRDIPGQRSGLFV